RVDRGDLAGSEEMLKRALAEAELLGDLEGEAEAWNNLGALALARGDAALALADHGRADRLHAPAGEKTAVAARTAVNRGAALLALGRVEQAVAEFSRARAIYDKLDDSPGVAK